LSGPIEQDEQEFVPNYLFGAEETNVNFKLKKQM